MAICKYCQGEVTLSPSQGSTCPSCGRELEFGPPELSDDTPHEEVFLSEMTVEFTPSAASDPEAGDRSDRVDSDTGAPEVELDFTHVFGGKYAEEFDLDEDEGLEEIALDEASAPDVTQPLGSTPAVEKPPSSKPGDTVRRPSDSTAPDATQIAGAPSSDSGGHTGWPTGVTMPAGLSGSDRPDSGSPDSGSPVTRREAETIFQDSGTQAIGSGRKSSQVHTPHSREITGLSSGRTVPRGVLGEGHASRSLKAGDVQLVGPEQIRLRAFRLGDELEKEDEVDFLVRGSAGKGGMGIVYRSQQRSLDRDVAVKQMKPELAESETDRNKFLTEAVITGQLEHPNIIPVHELGLASNGLPFYAMKFVIGDDWEDRIKKLSEQENLNILIQVANAIAFAHARNVIHRDLKPGNVRLGNYGEVLVMDWGLAARLDREGDIPPAGTPLYMAPETALEYLDYVKRQQGSGSKSSGTRRIKAGTYSDVYLLGALLFKIVTGKAPHGGKTPFECLRNAAKNRIVRVERSSELLDIAYKAMATNPADRYRTVVEFVDAVKAYQAHAQSIQIARRASDDLADAEEQRNLPGADSTATYAIFSSAQHGFQNALDLWPENRKAKEQLVRCRQEFAQTAYHNGDFAQALSLLDPDSEGDAELVAKIRRSQKQRQTRLAWFRTLQYATAASLLAALTFIAYSFKLGNDLFSARQDLALVEQEAQTKIASAEQEASERIATADREAVAKVESATQAADEKVTAAERKAEETITKAQLEADARIAEADVKVQQATERAEGLAQEAQYQQYLAKQGLVRSTLLEKGPYAASQEIKKIDPDLIASLNEKDQLEWTALLLESDWTKEATELAAIQLGQPRIATSPDGKRLAAAGSGPNSAQLQVFDTKDLTAPLHELKLDAVPRRVTICPNGRFVATVNDEADGGRLSVFDVRTGTKLQPAQDGAGNDQPPTSRITHVAFDRAGESLLTGDSATGVAEWTIDAPAGTITQRFREAALHQVPIVAVGYAPDGRTAFSADNSGVIRVWSRTDTGSLRLAHSYRHSDVAAGSPKITAAAMSSPSANSVALAYGCLDGSVYLVRFPLTLPENVADRNETQFALLVSRQAAAPSNRQAWDPDPSIKPDKLAFNHGGSVTDLTFANDGSVVISSGMDKLLVQDIDGAPASNREPIRRYHDTTVLSCSAGNGNFAYSSDEKGRVLRWKIDVPRKTLEFRADTKEANEVTAIETEAGGTGRIAIADSGGFTHVWSSKDSAETADRLFVGHADHGRMTAWHVPGASPSIVTIADDSRACVWDVATGRLRRSIELGSRPVVAVSADGHTLLAATDRSGVEARSFALDSAAATSLWPDYPRVSAMLPFRRANDSQQTIAIGLRDGQIYLRKPGESQVSLSVPVNRPHWRPIRSMAFDSVSDVLYAADTLGIISRWQLDSMDPTSRTAKPLNPQRSESVARLEVSADGKTLLAVVTARGLQELRLLDAASLEPLPDQPASVRGLTDCTFAPDGKSLLAIAAPAKVWQWNLDAKRWKVSDLSNKVANSLRRGEKLTGLRIDPAGGVLVFGSGFAQLWNGCTAEAELVSRVQSRPPMHLVSFRADHVDEIRSLAGDGRLDRWRQSGDLGFVPSAAASTALRGVVRACSSRTEGQAYVALRDASDQPTRIELWDLDAVQRLKPIGEPFDGICDSLTATADRMAYAAFADGTSWIQVVDLATGSFSAKIELPTGQRAASLALAPTDDRIVVCTRSRQAFVAHHGNAGDDWTVTPMDRDDVSAALFSPHGERIILGTNTGQVYIAQPIAMDNLVSARLLLALTGHSDRITLLKFDHRQSKLALLSGDATGRALLHPLE